MNERTDSLSRVDRGLLTVGVLLLSGNIIIGIAVGLYLKADTQQQSVANITMYTTRVSSGGTFNWMFFLLFLAIGLLSFAITYASAAIVAAYERRAS